MSDRVEIYDSTLRDGAQAEGITYSLEDKLLIARRLDELGVDYIEGGWPNPTNPKDLAFFERVGELGLSARVTAFGSTRRPTNAPEDDATLGTLLQAQTQSVAVFGKSWDLHVTEVLKTTRETNLELIEDSVGYLVAEGREVIYDAEHFSTATRPTPSMPSRRCVQRFGEAPGFSPCATRMVGPSRASWCRSVRLHKPLQGTHRSESTHTMTPAWAPQIRWPLSKAEPRRCRVRSTAMANAAAMPICAQ